MSEEMLYKLDLQRIRDDFKFDGKLIHSQGDKFKLLPYVANEKNIFTNFDGVTGALSRYMCDVELKDEFNDNEFIETVLDEIGDFEGSNSKESFKEIIKSMFLNENKLVDFDIKTMNYISADSAEEKIAKFLYSIFVNDEIREVVEKNYNEDVDNILYKLVLKALPTLNGKRTKDAGYKDCLPFVSELFKKDFKFLISNHDLYKTSLKRFLEYYYFFYVSQLTTKLSKFEKADLTKPDKLYFTLGWESLSKNRTSYVYGWEKLKGEVEFLFAHAIALEFLNHHNLDKQLSYVDLFNAFNEGNEEEIHEDIETICSEYIERRQEGIVWDDFKVTAESSGNKAFDSARNLYEAINFQFQGKTSTRTRAKDAYRNWFIKFVQDNFGKRRGSLGYCLTLNEEDIILLTKLCINNNERLKLSLLFDEFKKRGISFDRDSKMKIVQLYEKLNLIEKKSDSGDAQYVRSIL
ncbi:DNA phosphorothioation-dependent restriction protein DptG [uncultured Clostridium sp.]|uniref:DNA phosphorothioation-dependent restriction protein DptG n=1 Tax=uncultured Clostridium sp. TaxID=59620 RepID=UPI0025D6ACE1|nr:DNA phosphorothioation-dependent restriction protein DptG [uncultured Clostridium sp.]